MRCLKFGNQPEFKLAFLNKRIGPVDYFFTVGIVYKYERILSQKGSDNLQSPVLIFLRMVAVIIIQPDFSAVNACEIVLVIHFMKLAGAVNDFTIGSNNETGER